MANDLFIRLYRDKILHQVTEPIKVIDEKIIDLAGKMLVCMKLHHGAGLSANQVGVNKRLCVVSFENGTKDMIMVNPIIKDRSKEKISAKEGCLSAPKVYPDVKRSKRVAVEFQDLKGEVGEYEMTDMDARIIQHEVDHLNGITIVDNYMDLKLTF